LFVLHGTPDSTHHGYGLLLRWPTFNRSQVLHSAHGSTHYGYVQLLTSTHSISSASRTLHPTFNRSQVLHTAHGCTTHYGYVQLQVLCAPAAVHLERYVRYTHPIPYDYRTSRIALDYARRWTFQGTTSNAIADNI